MKFKDAIISNKDIVEAVMSIPGVDAVFVHAPQLPGVVTVDIRRGRFLWIFRRITRKKLERLLAQIEYRMPVFVQTIWNIK